MAYSDHNNVENYNRLFILGGKGCSEDDFRTAFSQYGTVKDLWIVRNRTTNEEKGVVYITFDKTSEAALAMEEMNGRCIPNNPRPLKVLIASSKKDGSNRDVDEDEKMLRLFVMVPRSDEENDVREKFKEFGDLEYVRILKDKKTGNSKGLAFVKYFRAYHAALALEQCDASHKAVFASSKPNRSKERHEDHHGGYQTKGGYESRGYERHSGFEQESSRYHGMSSRNYEYDSYSPSAASYVTQGSYSALSERGPDPLDIMRSYKHDNQSELEVLASGELTQEQLQRLFNIVPGLEYCNFDRGTGLARVKYSSAQCASYARDKLDSFEYPTGYRVAVRYPMYAASSPNGNVAQDTRDLSQSLQQLARSTQNIQSGDIQGNLLQLVDSIKKATEVLEEKGLTSMDTGDGNTSRKVRVRYCNIPLPETKPLASRESVCVERLFIVSQPDSFDEDILQDCFCRFGNLIDVYFMPGKNYGYAKFKDAANAKEALEALHGQKVCGMRVKVMHAEPPKYEREDTGESTKRPRV